MKIIPIPHGLDLLASDLVRSPGLHMSTIYGSLYEALEPQRFVAGSTPNPLMLALGTAWERYLEGLLAKAGVLVYRPGELMTPDGIAYSPDGVLDNGHLTLIEYKLTWMSSGDDISAPKYDKYRTQMMAYCYHLGTPYARLYVLHINGNYKPRTPVLRVFDLEFTVHEMQSNWDALMNHARHRKMLT